MEEEKKKAEDKLPPTSKAAEVGVKSEVADASNVKQEQIKEATSNGGASATNSDVKSELKASTSALAGLTTASATGEDMSDMDEATMRRALQEYMTMAQTANALQSAQQMALASGLLQAYVFLYSYLSS